MVKTQKARGIKAVSDHGIARFSTQFVSQAKFWPYSPLPKFPFFARPCPMLPRHGFVDSRIVRNDAEWLALIKEVKAANEPGAEVVMMLYIPCTWSGILTPAGLTLGTGHDGATSGHAAKQIPAASISKDKFLKYFDMTITAKEAGIIADPFVEFVEYNGKIEAVQLRNGKSVPLTETCVPKTMQVKRIITANGEDLMEWEQKMKALVAEEANDGVVIHHPGGAMSSHYAVQAMERSNSLLFPFAVWLKPEPPEIGAEIQKTSNAPTPLSAGNYCELAQMLGFAITNMSLVDSEHDAAIHLAVATLHASTMWGPDRHLLALRAAGLTYMLRFSSAAILGELRHWHGTGPGGNGQERATELFDNPLSGGFLSRDQIYEKAFKQHIKYIAPRMSTSYADFMAKGWGSAFGGKKWAACTKNTALLFQAASAFLKGPTNETWTEVMSAWNFVVNCFHNTGKLLNKFLDTEDFDTLAVVPSYGFISELAGTIAINADDFGLHPNPERVGEMLAITLPKIGGKPKPLVMPEAFTARWKLLNDDIYIQIALPAQVNKSYGMAQPFPLGPAMHMLLKTLPKDGYSLTGSQTPMHQGTIRFLNGAVILETTGPGYWIPLCGEASLKSLFMKTYESPDNDD